MEPREAQVGVLFVHGIGQQTPGDTLIAFGEPLVEWIRHWVKRSGREVQILKSALSEPVLESGEPAHLLFDCNLAKPDLPAQARWLRWLLAESCWATEFRNPPFGRLAAWMVGVGAWMILSHFGKFVRLRLGRWKRWALGLPVFLFAVLLALLVQFLVAILGLAALIPIPRLRRALSGLLLTLTGTLGDSYVLLSSPVQKEAAVSRLRRDITWLSARVEKVFVVAHSQGAAIAHEALQGPRPGNICRLITFGSGIGKLEELRLLAQPGNRNLYLAAQFGLPLATLSILLLPRAAQTLKSSYLLLGWELFPLLAPALLLVWILARTWSAWPAYLRHVGEKLPLSGLEWRDFYSTADPVPNGPLLVGESEGLPGYEGREIVNLRSAVADHSAYWANQDEFVTEIVREIDTAAGTGLISGWALTMRLAEARRARRRRVLTLLGMRTAAAAGSTSALFGLQHQIRGLTEELVWKPLAGWADSGLLGSIVGTLVSGLGAVARLVTGASAETLRAWGLVALGALLLSSAVALCYLVATRAWKWWDRFAIDDFFWGSESNPSTLVTAAVAVLLGATPLIFGGAALATGDLGASLAVVAVTFSWYLKGLAVVVLLVFGFMATFVFLLTNEHSKRVLVAGAAILVGVPLLTFFIAALVTRDFQRSLEIVRATNLPLAAALSAVVVLPVGVLLFGTVVGLIWQWWSRR